MTDIDVHVGFNDSTCSLLQDIPSHSLRRLILSHEAPLHPDADLRGVLQSISPHTGLRHLALVGIEMDTLHDGCLKLAGSYDALNRLELVITASAVHVTDEDVDVLTESLPRLTSLRLSIGNGSTGRPVLTLMSLAYVLENCSRLADVALWVDAERSRVPTHIPRRHRALRSLDLSGSPIDAVEAFGALSQRPGMHCRCYQWWGNVGSGLDRGGGVGIVHPHAW